MQCIVVLSSAMKRDSVEVRKIQVGPALSEYAEIKIGLYPKYSQNHNSCLSCVNLPA